VEKWMVEQPEVIGGHKILGEIGRGACGVVYKAQSPDSPVVVALKLLQTEVSSPVETLRFEREFRLTSSCEHPYLVKTHQYGTSQGQPFYTMELVSGDSFSRRFKDLRTSNERDALAKVVDAIFQGLEHIHDKRIVHRDLKPGNVLVNEKDEPRILDFGLARPQHGEEAHQLTTPGTVVGTVHYLSPEQLSSRPLDGRSDLFSVGTMIYEVLAGQLPFDADHPIGVFGQILSQPPAPLDLPGGFPSELRDLVLKLLEKEPSDRYQTAGEALAAWRKVMFGVDEQAKVREVQAPEQLYMPRFVGQSVALEAFHRVMGATGPNILLVRGRAGAGKSRFLEEVGALAKAKGFTHTGARASGQDSTPYHLWIPSLRQAFKRPKPAMMSLRQVLTTLLPELGYSKASATSKPQLFEAMARTLRLQKGLIWLDDVQLADSASLEFLHYLSRCLTTEDELTVVVTYDPDDMRLLQRTRDALIGAEFALETTLVPLTEEEVAWQVGSMLAGELDQASSLLLHGDTTGNPLYIGEAVKAALAEGRLVHSGGHWTLNPPSESPLTGTVRDQLHRQLDSLEPGDREVLKLAALIGFDFDFEVLAQVSEVPKMELLDRILRVSDKGFLIESEEDRFRFGSRALNQVLLESIPDEKARELHRKVAQVLETLLPRSRWVVDIALHYEAAGCPENAATHLLASGAEALRNFACADALDFYERALQVPNDKRSAMSDDLILEKISKAKQGLGRFEEAERQYKELLQRAVAPLTQVRLRRKIAECQQMLGNFHAAHDHLTEALNLVGVGRDPKAQKAAPVQWVQKLFREISSKFNSDELMSHHLHRVLDRQLSNLFFLRPPNWIREFFRLALLQEDVAKKLGNPESEGQAQIFLGFVELHNGHLESATQHWEKGLSIVTPLRDSPYKALLIRNMGLMHLLAGNADRARELSEMTMKISERLTDRPGLTQVRMVLCAIELHLAHFDEALEHARTMLTTADDAGLPVFRALGWSYLARATAYLEQDDDEARQHLAKAEELGKAMRLPYVDMMLWIARAWVSCDRGCHEECLQAADKGLELCHRIDSLPFYRLTLRCARLWSSVESSTTDRDVLQGQLEAFREDSQKHQVLQFVGVADELLARV
jgi:tetratricopeptide (TPR) repeat protein/tRNA A-37 threonylcarbamoyl transferase component Bud32